jgi:hypothetical protein
MNCGLFFLLPFGKVRSYLLSAKIHYPDTMQLETRVGREKHASVNKETKSFFVQLLVITWYH